MSCEHGGLPQLHENPDKYHPKAPTGIHLSGNVSQVDGIAKDDGLQCPDICYLRDPSLVVSSADGSSAWNGIAVADPAHEPNLGACVRSMEWNANSLVKPREPW
jgi:hypothetical protein